MNKPLKTTIAMGIVAIFLIGIFAVPLCQATDLTVSENDILFDGEQIHGLKGFTYKVYKDRQDVREIGEDPILNMNGNIQALAGTPLQDFMDSYFVTPDTGFNVEATYFATLSNQIMTTEQITFVFEGCVIDTRNAFVNENGEDIVEYQIGVCARVLVHSNSELLNKHMDNNTSFQVIISTIMQDSYPEGLGLKQFTFDGCHVDDREFQLDSHGYALTTYTFTGDRIREA